MKDYINSSFNYLLDRSDSPFPLYILQQILNRKISFNAWHRFKFLKLSAEEVIIEAPFIRANRNHLGGIHACAIATIGEYSAGLTLLKNFGFSNYRIIMKELSVEYIKQAPEKIFAKAIFKRQVKQNILDNLAKNSADSLTLESNIYNSNEEKIATVTTKWQIKDWKKVSFKA